ncbi:hypothetical protein BSQ98_09685 [Serratia liquefaciens]|uniref:hypothetical protein n=1 Tax=Serratia liquefaciens TaxID=614 RepID=UPI00102278AB|nr:hypothetical protein [Serratia liquefaciens]RYM66001.1 hypothetical protein BSQ98_09685 [Serratia liquefaciens]
MAGLTKEQRALRIAEQLATEQMDKHNPEPQEPQIELVAMVTHYPAFPGAPTAADVHPAEVENWIASGWIVRE